GMAIIPRMRARVRSQYDSYVATASGTIWVTERAGSRNPRTSIFVSGLTDPWGMVFAHRISSGDDGWPLYVADRATGGIYTYDPEGNQSIFVSDAGIPNFLVFETE